jgi:hypothetical protein
LRVDGFEISLFGVNGLCAMVKGLGLMNKDLGFKVQGSRFSVTNLGFLSRV